MFISNREKYLINKKLTEMEVAIRALGVDGINLRKELEGETTIRDGYSSALDEILGSYYGVKSVSLKLIVENLIDLFSYLLKKNTKASKKKEKNK